MTRHIKRGGQVWIRIFPDKPITKKPLEQRMGKGKAPVEGWVAVVKPGRILFEMDGVPVDVAREAMRLAIHKLPMACKFVTRADFAQGNPLEAKKLVARHGQEFVNQLFAGKDGGEKPAPKAQAAAKPAPVVADEPAPAEEPVVEEVMVVEDEVPWSWRTKSRPKRRRWRPKARTPKRIDDSMKDLKASELREKSVPDLEGLLDKERADLYKARRDLVFRQITDTAGLKVRRHNIARILTVIEEKKKGSQA